MSRTASEAIIAAFASVIVPCAPAGEAGAERLEGLTRVTIQAHNGEKYTERLAPGEWLERVTWTPLLPGRPGSLRFPYASGSHVRFDHAEPYMYHYVDGGPRRLAGVEVHRRGDTELLRRALAEKANPLTVWYDPTAGDPLPAIPADVQVALILAYGRHVKWDELLAACPHLWALSVTGEPPPPKVLARLDRLRSLRVRVYNTVLRDLSWAAEMPDLRVLHLEGQLEVTDLRPLSGLRKLQALTLAGCRGLSDLGPLRQMPNLAKISLTLAGNKELTDLSPLADMPNLEDLRLDGLWGLRDLGPLAKLRRLQTLELSATHRLLDLKPLGQCTGLTTLRLPGVQAWHLVPLASLSELRHLDLGARPPFSGPGTPEAIAAIGGLKRLESLRLTTAVADLGPLANLPNLTRLELAGCHSVKDLRPVGALAALTDLKLTFCGQLADLAPLADLTTLRSLHLELLGHVTDLAPLARLTALEDLRIWYCRGITDIRPLADMSGLTSLHLLGCAKLTDLTPLAGLKRLRSFWLVGCVGVSDLRPLALLPGLERVSLCGCPKVKDISPLRPMLRRGGRIMDDKDIEKQAERLREKWDF